MSLRQIRVISKNREKFFNYKKQQQKDNLGSLISTIRGPTLGINQLINFINGINQKLLWQVSVNNLQSLPITKQQELNLIMVTCLYLRPKLWKMVLEVMATMPIRGIVAVWSEEEDKEVIDELLENIELNQWLKKITFIQHQNFPLNQKWQSGITEARRFQPDAVLILGSDDIVTWEYIRDAYNKIHEGIDLCGGRAWWAVFIQDHDSWNQGKPDYIKICRYNDYRSDGEFIGAGRIISKRVLDEIKWKLYDSIREEGANKGLDRLSFQNLQPHLKSIYEMPIDFRQNWSIITLRESGSENISITYGKKWFKGWPGSSWLKSFTQKNRGIDYEVSQDNYVIAIDLIYKNFKEYIEQVR